VNIHADILHAIHIQGAPFWRGSSRTLKTLLQKGRPFILRRVTGKVPAVLTFSTAALRPAISLADSFSAVRTAWPAARSPHSFLKFRAYSLNVLSSRFRSLHGDNPADPLIAREWRNVLPFCPCDGIGNENLSQIRRYIVYCARGDRFLSH